MFRVAFATAAVAAAGLVACSSSTTNSPTATTTKTVVVTASYNGSALKVIRVGAEDHGPVSGLPEEGQDALDWEFDDPTGAVLASGSVPDPTHVISEFSLNKSADAINATNGMGIVEIRVPAVKGTLSVVRAKGAPRPDEDDDAGTTTLQNVHPLGICATGSTTCTPSSTALDGTTTTAPVDGGSGTMTPGLKKVVDKGACAPFNVLFVSEGFQASEMATFEGVVQKIAMKFANYPGYAEHLDDFNFWVLEVPSHDSGINDPGCTSPSAAGQDPCTPAIPATTRDTAFGASFGDNIQTPRRAIQVGASSSMNQATVDASNAIYAQALREARIDVTGFITNDPGNVEANYGGSADIPNKRFTTSTYDDPGNPVDGVAAHETGHALFKLADEYAYGSNSTSCAAEARAGGRGGPGPFPLVNVTPNRASPPWKSLVSTAPIQGAYYCMSGFYHPTNSCLMLTTTATFCPVCLAHANQVIKAKEQYAKCSCGGGDGGAEAGASTGDDGGSSSGVAMSGSSCTLKTNGQTGQCISTSSCSSMGGSSTAGLCPGASNIQCCVVAGLVVNGGQLVCGTGQQLVTAATANGWWPAPEGI